jgi:hypothetical protein
MSPRRVSASRRSTVSGASISRNFASRFRRVDLAAELVEQRAGALGLLARAVDLRFGVLLAPLQGRGARLQRLEACRVLLESREPRRQDVQLAARLRDGLAQLLKPVDRGACALDQGLIVAAFLPHLVQHRAHLVRELPILRTVAEQGLE